MEMEQSYGITVTNRFLIGGEDDIEDPEDFIKEKTKTEKVKSPSQGKGKKQDTGSNKKKQEIDTKSRKEDPKDSRTDSRRGGRGRNNAANSRPPRKGREGGSGGKRQEYTESVEDQENQAPNDLRNDRNERPPRNFGGRSPRERDGDRPQRTFGDRFGERPARDGDYGDRPPRGRGGRGRGGRGRGTGGREFRGKREFDRHSGSDKSSSFKPQDKREGGGNHNWGSFKDDVKEANTENTVNTFTAEDWDAGETHDVKTVPDKIEGEEAGTKEGDGPEEETVEKEPEVQEMTLDEYKALQATSRPKQDFNLRQAGEGENNSQWKKTYLLKKTPQIDADKEVDHEEHSRSERPKTKDQVDITVHFYDQPTRGGRGGRRGMGSGRGRGRGGRGGGRGGRSRSDEPHISLTDHNQFPSLDGN